MKHTLPWNVTGIPPEAREAARSAAHREGIAVGEWLTRRILSENARAKTAIETPEEAAPSYRYGRDEDTLRDRDDLAARLARSEAETDGAFRRIDDALRTMARRLESSERAQTEAHRAVSSAASEINAAARDQAEAFKLLTTRIVSVERQTDTGALRDAVRGLHQGLSRLADQIAKTANDSSGQIAVLTDNIEVLAGRVASAREESQRLGQSVEDRLAALDERHKQTENRIAAAFGLEERLKRAEESIASTSAPDEIQARLEARLNFAEERTQEALERHFASVGRNFEELASRLEKSERRDNTDIGFEDALRSLGSRIDAAEKGSREALAELEANLGETTKRVANVETALPSGGLLAATLPADGLMGSQFDLPPFPEPPPKAADYQTANDLEDFDQADLQQSEALASEPPLAHSSPENYLAHARRAAQAAAEPDAERGNRMRYRVRLPGEGPVPLAGNGASRGYRRVTQPLAFAALVLLLIAAGFQITRTIWREPDVAARPLNKPVVLDTPTTPGLAATGTTAGTSELATSAIPPQTAAEESGVVVDTPPPPSSPDPTVAALAKTGESGGTPTPAPAKVPAPAKQTAAGPALNASATTLSRLISQANSGDAKAALALGVKYANGDGIALNDAEALRWLQKAADAGEPVAQYRLGTFFEKGRAVEADQNQANRWYGEAAKRGNRKAMHALGVANANGTGGKKNFPEAVRWFKAAAELGLTDSQFNLAVLYERGLGVQTSLSEAYKWYAIAAGSGDSESKARVDALATQISAVEREAADRIAKGYKPQPMNVAANDGPPLTSN